MKKLHFKNKEAFTKMTGLKVSTKKGSMAVSDSKPCKQKVPRKVKQIYE